MYSCVHRPVNTPGVCDNKGSCCLLIEYLSKEGEDERDYNDGFFSQSENLVDKHKVLHSIDNNKRTLKRNDDKFYMLTVNPSQDELRHLIHKVTGKNHINAFEELEPSEKEAVLSELKDFSRECMNQYAQNFYREKIKDGNDLVWFGRIETERHYKGTDKAVIEGSVKSGDLKPGLNLHIHIVVSRMDKSQTVSLSPLARSKGNVQKLDGKDVVVGFDRNEWSSRCLEAFCENYGYISYQQNMKEDKEYEEWNRQVYLSNQLIRKAKREILNGELRNEFMALSFIWRTYKFVTNRVKAYKSKDRYVIIDTKTNKKNEFNL